MIERVPLDDRASLVEIVRKRMADDERRRIGASICAAKREHSRGRSKPVTPEELMGEILS